jgi:hypothetical protein
MLSVPPSPWHWKPPQDGQTTLERVTIFTDVQAAIKRIASEDPGLRPDVGNSGQKAHRDTTESQAGRRRRDPLVSSAQRRPGQREG